MAEVEGFLLLPSLPRPLPEKALEASFKSFSFSYFMAGPFLLFTVTLIHTVQRIFSTGNTPMLFSSSSSSSSFVNLVHLPVPLLQLYSRAEGLRRHQSALEQLTTTFNATVLAALSVERALLAPLVREAEEAMGTGLEVSAGLER
jgi:hypothetical protein